MKAYIVLFFYATFLLTPLVVRLIEKSSDVSIIFNLSEEELDSEKEIKAVFHFNTFRENTILAQSNLRTIFSENISKHEPISFSIFIPPPELA